MNHSNKNRKGIALILLAALLAPGLSVANEGYSFTDIDIPVKPVYTEDLLEVTDLGLFNAAGDQLAEFPEDNQAPENIPPNPQVQSSELKAQSSSGVNEEIDSFEAYRQSLINSWGGKKSFAEQRLSGIKENLEDQKKRFGELEKEINQAQEKLEPIREEVLDLQGQIDLINNQIQFTKERITDVEMLIAEKQIEIKDALIFLQRSEVELGIQKKIVLDYIKLLYQEENKFFDLYDGGSSSLKLLLADRSVSENLLGAEYFAVMEDTGRQVFHDLDQRREEIAQRQEEVLKEQADLEYLYERLNKEKRTYEEARLGKKELLEKTQGEEEKYTLLLEEALQQQLEAAIAVQNLQENIDLIEGKLDVLDDGLGEVVEAETMQELEVTQDTLDMMDSAEGQAVEEEGNSEETISGKPFAWPVAPNKITAEFHDPNYPKKWGWHNAIDIRAAQGTEIKAPANAYVFQTKDNGMGYSYIVLAHKNNLVTVYGHVSEILVTPGTTVREGEVIGLSGATPGTKGAGLQTTGPHLHFEVYKNGVAVDPLDYLPLDELPIEYVPDKHLEELKQPI